MRRGLVLALALLAAAPALAASPPPDQRGRIDAERVGQHDANRIRTLFWNFGMVGDYPPDPGRVDLSVFHSVEVPKGTGMNYSDGITPFVLAKIQQLDGSDSYIMETGYRERQGISPLYNRTMRFEPRPGYFQADPDTNRGRSPAISSDPRTWPSRWPDKLGDPDDAGWAGSWNGYFGKRPAADQESFTVMDDDFYDAWLYYPDSTDHSRHGLGLRVEVRGFQWANPQAGNVIFWHYDITNEGTTDYNDNILFGLYMDSGVGGSTKGCDPVFESDDDNAFFDRSSNLNLVYTWDNYGRGRDLVSDCDKTGYLGYAYLETPGNAFNGIDDDQDGITDETRDGPVGQLLTTQDDIRAYVATHYDQAKFEAFYGPLEKRPAFKLSRWWTGDEDMDWNVDLDDVGADGIADTHDTGEGDGQPTEGEPNFNRTDLNESDQLGLTGFKMNRIRSADGTGATDNVLFFTDRDNWPQRLYEQFTDPITGNRFDPPLATNYNIGFLFASGPFSLKAGKHERFSLALAFGGDLDELRENVKTVQQIYNANYQFAVPPPLPTLTAEAGDHQVQLSWTDASERGVDPVTSEFDFEGYRIYRATDPEFRDAQVISTGTGTGPQPGNGRPVAQFDLVDGKKGFSKRTINGVAYYLGNDSGITHHWTDTDVVNGQQYFYAVTAYDFGFEPGGESLGFYPSENAIAVQQTPRGGLILPPNVVVVRPNPRVAGFVSASTDTAAHVAGNGTGTVRVEVVNSSIVPDDHLYAMRFSTPSPDSIRASTYSLKDSTENEVLFARGTDLLGQGIGPVGDGLLPVVTRPLFTTVDSTRTGWAPGSQTDAALDIFYQSVLDPNLRRPGYPDDFTITFDDVVRDTGVAINPTPKRYAKFFITAHTDTGDVRLRFRFNDIPPLDSTLTTKNEFIDVIYPAPVRVDSQTTWRIRLDPDAPLPTRKPRAGDVYHVYLSRPLNDTDLFTFRTGAEHVDASLAVAQRQDPYVVPNPYVGAASFEPAPFAISGRGERRLEFRSIPLNAVVRIYTVRGELVQTLRQDGGTGGFVAWNLRTKDNLDVAPGLYLYQVEATNEKPFIGKFAVIK